MTTTLSPAPTAAATAAAATDAAAALLDLLADTLDVVARDDDLDRYASRTPAGTALTSLSAIARRAAAALGATSGVELTEACGVVVVRDLVAATRLLVRALGTAVSADAAALDEALTTARGVAATFRQLLTAER